MNKMMLKPIIKKIIDYLVTNNGISQNELNKWIGEMGFKYKVVFEHGTMNIYKVD